MTLLTTLRNYPSAGPPPTGGPFPHFTRRRMTGGMIEMGMACLLLLLWS